MHLNRGVEYGIEGLTYLARAGGDRSTLLREVSRATSIPETFLSKIFQRLVRSGLVRSRRGFRGGFLLARPASQITLREVVEALQGPINAPTTVKPLPKGGVTGRAQVALHQVLARAQARVRAVFEEITVADLAATGVSATVDSR
jgi:Rrf2 family transcriptional regulator, iron-sulfur cluster assembly transcription factor